MKLYLATGNRHKVGEVAAILAASGIAAEVRPPSDLGGLPDVVEDAASFEGNARKKALALAARLHLVPGGEEAFAMADDSGLCVDALGGAPGVISARFAGVGAGDAANTARLLHLLEPVTGELRSAMFRCCIVVATRDGRTFAFEGHCPGRIIESPRGTGGFGYDPVFVPDGHELTFAELPAETKNTISHRARALAGLVEWLRGLRV
jgi:XTP/dITP diphosphohydrolase